MSSNRAKAVSILGRRQLDELRPHFKKWILKLCAPCDSLVLHSMIPHDGLVPGQFVTVSREAPESAKGNEERQREAAEYCFNANILRRDLLLYERVRHLILGDDEDRPFDIDVWCDSHGWFDGSSDELSSTLLKDIQHIRLAIHLQDGEDLIDWIDVREQSHKKSAFFKEMMPSSRLDVCVVIWEEESPLSRGAGLLTAFGGMIGDALLVSWLMESTPADIEIRWSNPNASEDLEKAGASRRVQPWAFLAIKSLESLETETFIKRPLAREDSQIRAQVQQLSASQTARAQREEKRLRSQEEWDAREERRTETARKRAQSEPLAINTNKRQKCGRGRAGSLLDKISKPVQHKAYKAPGLRIK